MTSVDEMQRFVWRVPSLEWRFTVWRDTCSLTVSVLICGGTGLSVVSCAVLRWMDVVVSAFARAGRVCTHEKHETYKCKQLFENDY